MDYDAMDRAASRYVLVAWRNGSPMYGPLYLGVHGTTTDRADRALVFRDGTDATLRALQERKDEAWGGIEFRPVPAMGFSPNKGAPLPD